MVSSPISVTVAFNRLPAVMDAMRPAVLAACQATGAATVAEGRRRAHVVSGKMRDSIRTTEGVMSNDVITIVVYADVPYAFVEEQRRGGRAEGRPFSGSHAFLGPAAEQERMGHVARVAAALNAAAGAG